MGNMGGVGGYQSKLNTSLSLNRTTTTTIPTYNNTTANPTTYYQQQTTAKIYPPTTTSSSSHLYNKTATTPQYYNPTTVPSYDIRQQQYIQQQQYLQQQQQQRAMQPTYVPPATYSGMVNPPVSNPHVMYTNPSVYGHAGTAGMMPAYHAGGITGMVSTGTGTGMHQAKVMEEL